MYNNPYLTHPLAKERVNEAVREAEKARLIKEMKATGKTARTNLRAMLRKIDEVVSLPISFSRVKSEPLAPHGEPTA
jgi:hypothetical protein